MKISYNLTGAERKSLVGAISSLLNAPAKYLGMPTANYEVGGLTVTKTGEIAGEDNRELISGLQEVHSYVPVSEEYDAPLPKAEEAPASDNMEITEDIPEPDTLTIELPWRPCGDLTNARENLRRLIESKATLIKAALGDDGTGELPIEFTENDTVKFKWLNLPIEHDVQTAWTEFLCAAVKFAKKSQRVTAKDTGLSDNPKFDFRCVLVKIGLKGAEHKAARKILLRNLPGSTAFKNAESEKRWKEKYAKNGGADGAVSE